MQFDDFACPFIGGLATGALINGKWLGGIECFLVIVVCIFASVLVDAYI